MTNDQNRHRLLIVIATYNEIETLPLLVRQLRSQLPDAVMMVIDDNSPDGTGAWCQQQTEQYEWFRVLHRPAKLGLGTATALGLQSAIDQSFQFVATLDADLSHDPTFLAQMFQAIVESMWKPPVTDALIGSRYVRGGQIIGWPWYRHASSRLVNAFARGVLRLPTYDNSSALRIYRVEALAGIEANHLKNSGYAYLEEILLRLHRQGANLREWPITFHNRRRGRSKADLWEMSRSLFQILRLYWQR